MCSSFTGEEVGKDKAFTHKSQHVKRIEGRGEGKKRKVAECAMRGRGRKRECAYTRERAGRVSETGEQNGNEGRGTERKGGGGRSKRGGSVEKQGKKGKKARKFSTSEDRIRNARTFCCKKSRFYRKKMLTFASE